ncbi:MAG: putative diguanylate cyclase [Methanocella sp. PtaU1.Bin125]|nr:MAG: putative diguanylate cyclase [Methanocella sp. PtaU1.Bin125]
MGRKATKPASGKSEKRPGDRRLRETPGQCEDEYLPLISSFLDIVYAITPGGIINYISPRIAHYGYEPGDLLAHSIFDFMTADCREHMLARLHESLTKGESTPTEFKLRAKDGQIYWMEALGKTIYDDAGQPLRQVGVIRDITLRKRAEHRLRESEDKYRNLVEQVNDWVWEIDTRCRYSYASPRVRDLLGYAPEEMIGKSPFDFMPCGEAERVRSGFEQIFLARREFSLLENTLARKDGGHVIVETSGMPMFDADGRFAGYRGIDRDITGRKRAEEEVNAARNMLQLIMNNIPEAIFWKDRDSRYLGCNKVFAKAAGLASPADIVGKTDYDLPWSREQAESFRSYDRRIMETDVPEYYIIERQREADGKLAWIETNKVPLHDAQGNVIGILGTYEDITERKRAEEMLRRNETLLRKSQEIARLGSWELDLANDRLVWSDEVYRIYGIQPGEFDGTYAAFLEAVHPDDREAVDVAYTGSVRGGRDTYEIEHRVIRKSDGDVRVVHEKYENYRDLSGQIVRSVGVVHDITERKRAEEALKQSEANLERAQRIAALGSWEWDLKTDMLSGSREYYRMFGLEPSGPVPFDEFASRMHPDDLKWVKKVKENLNYDNLPDSFDFRILAPGGEVRYIHSEVEVVKDRDGQPVKIFGTMQDVTRRKQVEMALRESEALLNSIFRSAPTGIGVVVDRVIKEVNEKLCRMTGYAREELVGQSARMLYPSDMEYEYVGKVKYDMIAERGVGDVETRWRRKDGRVIDILLSSSPIDPANLSAGVTFTALDITNRKRAENEVIEAKSQAELYLDLLGHDINNLHQIALGYLELARDMPPTERQNEYLDKPIEVLQRSARLIKNVRKLQKLQEGVFQAQEVDIATVLADVRREFGAVPGKTVTLNLNRCEHCYVRANGLLYDVFANLVSNAIKHTGDRADIVIDMDIVNDGTGRYCRVIVEDNGPGVPDDFKGRIFNRMLKGDSRAKGMGLGLYLVKSLVESYEGRVWVEDRITGDHTKGARFVVMLPVV